MGASVGADDGSVVGTCVGAVVGSVVGADVGASVGADDGSIVGLGVGVPAEPSGITSGSVAKPHWVHSLCLLPSASAVGSLSTIHSPRLCSP